MTHHWDELSKSLAEESLPRRESLRRIGTVLAGAVLSPWGLGTAFARGQDPCKAFCRCRDKSQQNACLSACRACSQDTSRLCGACGSYACTDFASDLRNCGACGNDCRYGAGAYEETVCLDGQCLYACVQGAVACNGTCTFLDSDPNNCGACGNVCPASAPVCVAGACIANTCVGNCPEGWCGGDGCGGECACPSGYYCEYNGWCYPENNCPAGLTLCGGSYCADLYNDPGNCGACGWVCGVYENCTGGACVPNDPPASESW